MWNMTSVDILGGNQIRNRSHTILTYLWKEEDRYEILLGCAHLYFPILLSFRSQPFNFHYTTTTSSTTQKLEYFQVHMLHSGRSLMKNSPGSRPMWPLKAWSWLLFALISSHSGWDHCCVDTNMSVKVYIRY